MPSRGRHQSTSKECKKLIQKIEKISGVKGVVIGYSIGGKSLGRGKATGAVKIQRREPGGFKAVTQSEKGLQNLFILVEDGHEEAVEKKLLELN